MKKTVLIGAGLVAASIGLSLADVTPGNTVTVWTREDVALDTSVTALRIEPGL